jgi:hypothetical protein
MAGEYLIEVLAANGAGGRAATSDGRLVVRRGLAAPNAPCSVDPWAAWATPERPTFPGCTADTKCIDGAVPNRAGGIYEADGLGRCIAMEAVGIDATPTLAPLAEPGASAGFTWTIPSVTPGFATVQDADGACAGLDSLRLRLYRDVDGVPEQMADFQTDAGTCPIWENGFFAGTYYALVESPDPDATIENAWLSVSTDIGQ